MPKIRQNRSICGGGGSTMWLLERAVGDHLLVLARPVVLELLERDAAGEDHRVHRELLRAEVRVEEVDREDEADREQRLVAVDDRRHVEERAGQDLA